MAKKSNLERDAVLERFGNRLRSLRKQHGLTQEEIAQGAGFSRSYYTDIETGKRNISLVNICKLAHYLQVSPKELVDF